MDIGLVVFTYLDRCERVGRQPTFSALVESLCSEGATAEEVFHAIRWIFSTEYAVRTQPNQFALTEKGFHALDDFRMSSRANSSNERNDFTNG